jgi:hypothetical protein
VTTSRPPFIAAWILYRFGPMAETDAIAGDLAEQYQRGRSRSWYWREVTVALFTGTWSEIKQYPLLLLSAVTLTVILAHLWELAATPFEYPLLVRYVFRHQPRPQEIPLLGFLIDAPWTITAGWILSRYARRCLIPAVLIVLGMALSNDVWWTWSTARIAWPASLGYHFSLWSCWWIPLQMILFVFGAGLLTGSPKRRVSRTA